METTQSTKRNWVTVAAVIIAVLALLLLVHECTGRAKDKSIYEQNEAALKDTVQNIKNDLGGITAAKLVLQKSNADLQKELSDAKKNGTQAQKELAILAEKFKQLTAVGSAEIEIKYDTIEIPFQTAIPCDFTPFVTEHKSDWFNAKLFIQSTKAEIIDIYIPTRQHIVFGYKANGLFKKPQAVMETTFTNPNIHVTEASGTITVIDTPWYKKWYIWLAAGLLTGIGIAH